MSRLLGPANAVFVAILTFGTSVLVPHSAVGEPRLVVGNSPTGTFYWRGHKIAPPYEVSITYHLGPDTVWTGTFLNDLPLEAAASAASATAARWPGISESQQDLYERIRMESQREGESGLPMQTRLQHMAKKLEASNGLVDSATYIPPDELRIAWHGKSAPISMRFQHSEGLTPAGRWDMNLQLAQHVYSALNLQCLVVWGQTQRLYIPKSRAAEYERGIQKLQNGARSDIHVLQDSALAAEFIKPRPVQELVREMKPKQ